MLSADWARLPGLDQAFAAFAADTIVAAGHDQSVLLLAEADQTLLVRIFLAARRRHRLALLRAVCVEPIDRFDLEWSSVDLKTNVSSK